MSATHHVDVYIYHVVVANQLNVLMQVDIIIHIEFSFSVSFETKKKRYNSILCQFVLKTAPYLGYVEMGWKMHVDVTPYPSGNPLI